MRKRISFAIALAALLAVPALLFAQSKPATSKAPAISVTLEYFENNSGIFDVRDDKGASVPNPQFGDELKLGWTVVTGKGDLAELKMTHTGTIIKVAQSTNFRLDTLRSDTGGQDLFTMTVGKIRTVAGKASGKDLYQIRTTSAVCGVRGSDVVIETLEGTRTSFRRSREPGGSRTRQGRLSMSRRDFPRTPRPRPSRSYRSPRTSSTAC